MRKVCIILFSLFTIGAAVRPEPGDLVHRLIVQPSSKITINGKTNVNNFTCAIKRYTGKDTLVLIESGKRKPVFRQGAVGLLANSFDCGLQLMTNDFAQTIKAKEYPNVSIEFVSFERVPRYDKKEDAFKGRMKISLAGVTKPFEVDCTIETQPDGIIHLKGGRTFAFKDFNLEAPSRMMGLVKVQETLQVSFHLVLLLDMDG
ncbi:MAG: YceI family protein [Cyclobacteriaceae bacterium]